MVLVYEVNILLGKETQVNEVSVIWAECEVFESQKVAVLDAHNEVFDPNTEFTLFVVAGLIAYDHSRLENVVISQ
jgi:hypothetical protein